MQRKSAYSEIGSNATSVTIDSHSGLSEQPGFYSFAITVGADQAWLDVCESIAFDYLHGWTLNFPACLDCLRRQNRDLARRLEIKIAAGHGPDGNGRYLLGEQDRVVLPLQSRGSDSSHA